MHKSQGGNQTGSLPVSRSTAHIPRNSHSSRAKACLWVMNFQSSKVHQAIKVNLFQRCVIYMTRSLRMAFAHEVCPPKLWLRHLEYR